MNRTEKNILPPDLFSRNEVIAYLTGKLAGREGLRVLDVGGYMGRLELFLPEGTAFTILDQLPRPEGETAAYIQADAQKIPFSDKSFDVVIASDMLEHVDKPFRAPIIREMLRVSKNHVIIGVPCHSDLLEKAESAVMDQYKILTGRDHPFLSEHGTYGLPEESKIEEILRKEGVNYALVKEGNLMNWYIQQLYAVVQYREDLADKKYEFFRFFNDNLGELGNTRAPTYRSIFVIAKSGPIPQQEIIQELQQRNMWKPARFMEALQKAFNDLRLVIGEKEGDAERLAHARAELEKLQIEFEEEKVSHSRTHQLLRDSEGRAREQNERLEKARETLGTYREAVQEARTFLQEKEKTIVFLKNILEEKDEKISVLEKWSEETRGEMQLMKVEAERREKFILLLNEKIEEGNREVDKLKKHIHRGEEAMAERDTQLRETGSRADTLETELEKHRASLLEIYGSRAWKVIMAYSRVKTVFWTRPLKLIKKGYEIFVHLGPAVFWRRLIGKIARSAKRGGVEGDWAGGMEPYNKYIENERMAWSSRGKIAKEIREFEYKPVISIVMPVYNVEERWLRKAIESVRGQWYGRWELCICDDASTDSHIKPVLGEYAVKDSRVKVVYRDKNGGIVKATNAALKQAQGAYVGFLDNDDELAPQALYEVINALQEAKYDLVYSDEDKLDMEGKLEAEGIRCEPFFKPDWSPDLLLSHNYICHFAVYRRKILNELGGLREGFDGSQDYDLLLRFTEKAGRIKHIAKILYHWRKIPGSAAARTEAKPYAFDAAKKALADAVRRRGIKADITDGQWKGSYRIKRKIDGEPLVSIIIPFKDKIEVLKPCLDSILTKTTWKNYEILLVNNRSELLKTAEYLEELSARDEAGAQNDTRPRIHILSYDKQFNFAEINNFAAERAAGQYLILLNNDTEVITPDWIENMLEHAQRPEVGAVGAKLLFPGNKIQHAGVLIGIGGIANHAFLKQEAFENGYFGQANVIKNYSAVTGACMMVSKNLYEKMGGLDNENLGVAFNDVDFCLRLREKNYLVVYTPYAQLYHHESMTRGYEVEIREVKYMQQKHGSLIKRGDPYYNQNLSRERFDFSLRTTDAVKKD
ncbi:glycosyltransferase [Patescibacteria group bacterium]|nr:glycosyltransferase [Patescibacteria group bacterium]MBU1702955.1 glycosyltransferase [Patescibacteria group bacterium]MBU1953963.1 glycosyltransferase [Patescibacteria group bacterium]